MHYGYSDYPSGQLRTTSNNLAKFMAAYINNGIYNGNRILESETVEIIKSIPFKLANIQLALFSDIAYFPRSYNLEEIKGRRLSDAGIGFRTSKNLFGKQLYLRLDFPLVTNDSNTSTKQEFQWIFSFERSI